MTIWLTLLLTLLPKLLELLLDLFARKEKVSGKQLDQLNRVVWYADQIAGTAPKVGARTGGTPPARQAAGKTSVTRKRATSRPHSGT